MEALESTEPCKDPCNIKQSFINYYLQTSNRFFMMDTLCHTIHYHHEGGSRLWWGRGLDDTVHRRRSFHPRTSTMRATKLQLANCNAIASIQLTTDSSPMRRTIVCASPRHLLTPFMGTLFATTVFDAESGGGLGGLVAAFDIASFPASVRSAKRRSSHCGFVATIRPTALATTMRRTVKFVARSFIASRESASATTTMCNTETRRPLGAFRASVEFT
jgi:hypothetical protein